MNEQLTNRGRVGRKGDALLMVNINRIHVVVKESFFEDAPPFPTPLTHAIFVIKEVRHRSQASEGLFTIWSALILAWSSPG